MDRNRAAGFAHEEKINEYIMKGYARKLDPSEVNNNESKVWYLPHFVIDKPRKPGKYRLVFDAAAKIHGKSLNDYLLTGPDLLNSLASVIIKFRQNQIGFSGDIRDMFHQVRVRKEDLASQRFLWRGWDREKKPDIYQMEVLIFGGTSSPTSTIFVTHKNADAHREEYPEAAAAIKTKHYMDDYLDSKSTVKDAIQIIQGVTEVHRRGGFEITGWVSNSEELIKLIPEEHSGERMKNFDSDAGNKVERVLGLHWDTTEDCWSFPINFKKMQSQVINGETHPTKRQILGVVMSIFDPIGLIAHYTVKGKMLLQAVWRSGYGWDDEITGECLDNWKMWIHEFESIKNLKIPRCYATFNCEESEVELHVFCDASELAYAAAAYLRIDNGRRIEASLVMAKSRVAPLKSISIPRMELMAAVMGTRLGLTVKKELEFEIKRTVYWSDNKTVLCWIRAADTRRYKQFVAHRVGEILESTEGSNWKWVPTLDNVADDATRNTPSDLTSNARWFRGPEYLCQEAETWLSVRYRSEDRISRIGERK
ncbi:Pol polyprotein [Folsomia candida]|uniref:Pol polyprotein n=1 Tax=Folsomia candida TaxID=158441 RepID=A0A226CZ98_FOLCA|nr:Pol polyprotein [Folsomia candida]